MWIFYWRKYTISNRLAGSEKYIAPHRTCTYECSISRMNPCQWIQLGHGVCWEDDVVTRFMTRSARVSGINGAGLFGRRNEMAMGDGYQLRDLSCGRGLNLVLGVRKQLIS